MKTVLLIACICLASAAATTDAVVTLFSKVFGITEAEARHCIESTHATEMDLRGLDRAITEATAEELLQESEMRRAACAATCAAQAQGTMVGAKMQPAKLHELVNKAARMPEDVRMRINEFIDVCVESVKDVTNECETGLRFIMCMIERNRVLQS